MRILFIPTGPCCAVLLLLLLLLFCQIFQIPKPLSLISYEDVVVVVGSCWEVGLKSQSHLTPWLGRAGRAGLHWLQAWHDVGLLSCGLLSCGMLW
jgi:hypothetical protein